MADPIIQVNVIAHYVPLAAGDCPECGTPASYNTAAGIVFHDDEADHDACPLIVMQRAIGELLKDAAEQLERLGL